MKDNFYCINTALGHTTSELQ